MSAAPISDDLLARYLAGESTPEEDRIVLEWVAISPANRIEVERLRAAWEAGSSTPAVDLDAAWRRLKPRLTDAAETTVIPIDQARGWRQTFLRAAAAVMLLLGGGLLWQQLRRPTELTYVAGADERLEVTLSDGSVAMLAPRTTLRVDHGYGATTRSVSLDGEAWFHAVHEGVAPFTVTTPTHVVRDVGTEFTVRARETGLVEVAVIAGEVAVSPASASGVLERTLLAGDVGRFRAGTVNVAEVESGRSIDSLAGWHRGALNVEAARVRDVLAELSRWYGMSITVADSSLANRTITGSLSLVSRDAALEVLTLLLNVSAHPEGAGIVLR